MKKSAYKDAQRTVRRWKAYGRRPLNRHALSPHGESVREAVKALHYSDTNSKPLAAKSIGKRMRADGLKMRLAMYRMDNPHFTTLREMDAERRARGFACG